MERLQGGKENKSKAKKNLNPQPFEEIYENSPSPFPLRHNSLKNILHITLLNIIIILKDQDWLAFYIMTHENVDFESKLSSFVAYETLTT